MIATDELRAFLAPWGALRPQPVSDWQGPFPLPESVAALYEHIGPWGDVIDENEGPVGLRMDGGGLMIELPPLHKLWELQDGYAWSKTPTHPLPSWPENGLVIASQEGDPFMLDRASGEVFFAFHGAGSWTWRPFAPDLFTALACIATVAVAYAKLDKEADFDDFELLPPARQRVVDALIEQVGHAQAQKALDAWQWCM